MNENYIKECYDPNQHISIHYSYGVLGPDSALGFLHYDKDLIIEYYRRGEASIHIEGNFYNINEGDIIILNPDEVHVSTKKHDCYMEKIVLHISDTLLHQFGADRTVFFDTISKKPKGIGNLISADTVEKLFLNDKINDCLDYAKNNSLEAQVLITCKIIELLYELSNLVDRVDDTDIYSASSNKTANQIMDYINRHYTEDITLETLAERFHFSKYYISHLFKDYVGISPYDYLIIRRLYVCNNLIRGKYTVRQACLMVGFNNYSNFYRLYKKHFKITPQQFKEQLKSAATI